MSETDVLDEVERRIRNQAARAQIGSMEWRAHMADLMHIEAVRNERLARDAQPPPDTTS